MGALTKGADCLSLPLDGADYGLHLPPGPDLSVPELHMTVLMFFVQELPAARTEPWQKIKISIRELLMPG